MQKNKTKIIKKILFGSSLIFIIVLAVFIAVKYNVEGEKDLPFHIEKIRIVSLVDAKSNEDSDNIWNISLIQNNNIYIDFKRNEDSKNDTIKEITLNNIIVSSKPKIGVCKVYRPTGDFSKENVNKLYENSEHNYLNESLTYNGAQVDNLKALEINNSGGMIAFRFSIEDLGNYVSNNYDEEVVYNGTLLEKKGISEEDLKSKLNFDVIITLNNNVKYSGNISLDLPVNGIISGDDSFVELTDFSNVVFKRVK